MHKNMLETTLQSHQSCSVQKMAPKITNIERMTAFRKWLEWATIKRLYSLCEMVSLGRKFKSTGTCEKRLYNSTTVVLRKKWLQKIANIGKITAFRKWPKLVTMQRLQLLQNGRFGSKIKMNKNMRKTTPQSHQSCSVQKTPSKKANIRNMTALPKWPKLASIQVPQSLQNGHFGKKIEMHKNLQKTTLLSHQTCSVQKKKKGSKKQLIFEFEK